MGRINPWMALFWFLPLPFIGCGMFVWYVVQPHYQHHGTFHIGNQRRVIIWSEGDDDPLECCAGVYYKIMERDQEIVSTTFIDSYNGKPLQFRIAAGDQGNLVCVYETERATKNSAYFIMFDSANQESWPRLIGRESCGEPKVFQKWLACYRRLRQANLHMPQVAFFENRPPPANLIAKPAPALKSKYSFNGATQKIADLKGKVVLVQFWAMWCVHCLPTYPRLQKWHRTYQKDGLEIVGVTTYFTDHKFDKKQKRILRVDGLNKEQEHQSLRDYAAHFQLPYRMMTLSKQDWAGAEVDFGFQALPVFVLIDRRGRVRLVLAGSGERIAQALETEIKRLLGED